MRHAALKLFKAAIAAVLFTTAPAFAQDGPPGNVVEMWTVKVKPGAQGAFEEAVKAHMALRAEHDDPSTWAVFTNNTGNDFATYYFRHCCFSWADRDAIDAWETGTAAVREDWAANADPHVESYEHDFETIDFENSHWPEDMTPPKFVGVTSYRVKPGKGQQLNAVIGELSQIARNKGWSDQDHEWAWMSSVNGKPSVTLAIPHADYADMAPPDPTFFEFLTGQVGEEEAAAMFQRFTDSYSSSSYQIYTSRPDLSSPE